MEFWNNQEFRDWYKKTILREKILEVTSGWLLELTATDQFLHRLGLCLTLSMGVSHVAVLVYDYERGFYRIKMSCGMKKLPSTLVKLDNINPLVYELDKKLGPNAKLSDSAQSVLKALNGEMCIPLFVHERFVGMMLIGPRVDRKSYDPDTIKFFHAISNDIGVEIEKEDYYQKSQTDPLTDLYNRNYLNDTMDLLGKHLKQFGGRVALALIDVDHFKQINDTYGHTAGDYVLRMVADKIKKNVRASDPCIRYGGEEFCIVFSDFIKRDGTVVKAGSEEFFNAVHRLVERLRHEIGETVLTWEGKQIRVTVSIGLAFLDNGIQDWDVEKLIQDADEMLYAAKRAGRNCVLVKE